MRASVGATVAILGAVSAIPNGQTKENDSPKCRFALDWSQEDILSHTDDFVSEMLFWEANFHQHDLAYNKKNGMSYDGSQIDYVTGDQTKKHTFSAASKEVCCLLTYYSFLLYRF